jgi:propanediol dehydratase-reactivating factor small subunit
VWDQRADRTQRARPAVVVRYLPGEANRASLREVAAGLEEEGVPWRLQQGGEGSAPDLAFDAARASALSVGLGVDAEGAVCVHHAKLPAARPVATGPAGQARVLGHNAARLVTGIPFK